MDNWTFQDFLKLTGSLILSVGGSGVIILGLSKWFGDFLANRLLAGQRFKHESDLERIKSQYQSELEKTKLEIEKAKMLFHRYSEKQFQLYNDLWKVLWDFKLAADNVWDWDTKEYKELPKLSEQLPKLSNHLATAKRAIGSNVLIIEEEHYEQLLQLIDRFEEFILGSNGLEKSRRPEWTRTPGLPTAADINEYINAQIEYLRQNHKVKKEYDNLLKEVAKEFRKQIKG